MNLNEIPIEIRVMFALILLVVAVDLVWRLTHEHIDSDQNAKMCFESCQSMKGYEPGVLRNGECMCKINGTFVFWKVS